MTDKQRPTRTKLRKLFRRLEREKMRVRMTSAASPHYWRVFSDGAFMPGMRKIHNQVVELKRDRWVRQFPWFR